MTWHDTRKMLHEDHRWRLTKLLDKTEKQRLFEEHVAALTRRNRDLYHRVIDEFINPVELMTISYRDVRKRIKDDPRFAKFSSSDRVRVQSFLFFVVCSLSFHCLTVLGLQQDLYKISSSYGGFPRRPTTDSA